MLYYNRIDIIEGIDAAKSNSKECMICHYWFFNHGFKFQDSLCNVCHDLTMLYVNISDIASITDKNVNYWKKTKQIWSNYVIRKFCPWRLWLYIKMHIQEINIKKSSLQLSFWQYSQSKKIRN